MKSSLLQKLTGLMKSRVKGYIRKAPKSGKTVVVSGYDTSKQAKPKAPPAKPAAAKVTPPAKPARRLPSPVVKTDSRGVKTVLLTKQGPAKRRADAPKVTNQYVKGAQVMFKPEGGQRLRLGTLISVGKKTMKIQGRRNPAGDHPIFTVPRADVMTLAGYKKAVKKRSERKTDEKVYTSEGDRANANFNVTSEEWQRRMAVGAKRLKRSEEQIVTHPGFKGVAFKICSDLAKENRIPTTLSGKKDDPAWHRAIDPDYQEILLHYFSGALNSLRTELSRTPYTKQIRENVAEFRKWVDGKVAKSYISTTMAIDGRRAAIRYIQDRRKRLAERHSMDIGDMETDPESRHLLQTVSSEPQQERYLMQRRGETLPAAVQSLLNRLGSRERLAIAYKLGLPPYEPKERSRDGRSNEDVAKELNDRGMLDGKLKYTRNSVGKLVRRAVEKMREMPEFEDLKYYYDDLLGRNKVNLYHAPQFRAGTTTDQDEEARVQSLKKAMGDFISYLDGLVGYKVGLITKDELDELAAKDRRQVVDEFHAELKSKLGQTAGKKKTMCVDFDGVIADYSQGFKGVDIFGDPMPGVAETMQALTDAGWRLIVFTTRPDTPALRQYLEANGIPFDAINENPEQPEGANPGKPIADVYLDDRAYRFQTWEAVAARFLGEHTLGDEQMAKSSVYLTVPLMLLPEEMHPEGLFEACGVSYEVEHRDGMAVLSKAQRDDEQLFSDGFDGLADLAAQESLRKSLEDEIDGGKAYVRDSVTALILPEGAALEKSFSSDMERKYPGGRWVTIKEGPLAGRHIYILPHKDGSASVLVGGGPAMRHKVLRPKQNEEKKAEAPTEAKKKEEPKEEEPEQKPKLSADEEQKVKERKKEIKTALKRNREEMAAVVREKIGEEVEITESDKKKIEEQVAKIEDPEKRKKVHREELAKVKKQKDDKLSKIMDEVRNQLVSEDPAATSDPQTDEEKEQVSLRAAVKECAEELAEYHYKIKALKRENSTLNKMIRTGKSFDKFKAGNDVTVGLEDISKEDIQETLAQEHLLDKELAAHYTIVEKARGIEGVSEYTKGGKLRGGLMIEKSLRQGGFEALTGFVGGMTGSSIMKRAAYDELGSDNAAILARYYLEKSGTSLADAAETLDKYIGEEGNPVALRANDQGLKFMAMARRIHNFGLGSENLMTIAQATGASLKYSNLAYESFGQAEGALNQGAELVYALKNNRDGMEIVGNTKDAIQRKRRALGLNAKDVSIRHISGEGYKMTIPPRSFEKLIDEAPTDKHGRGLGFEYSPQEVKALQANTDDFRPSSIREYTPEDKQGRSRKIVAKPEQQAAARLIAQQKRVYLNFEAGVGKSFAILLAKGHIEDTTGKQVKTIVTMPSKLMRNFKDEVEKFSNYKVVIADSASKAQRIRAYNADPNTIVLVNKEKFYHDRRHIAEAGFNMVVADEAHKITQREGRGKSMMSQGLKDAAAKAEYYVAMSGTPTPSDLSELYFHANLINPERFHSQKDFMKRFGSAHKGGGYKEAIAEFMNTQLDDHVFTAKKSLTTNFTLHRHESKLSEAQRKGYKEISDSFLRREINPLQRDQQYNNLLNSHDWRENGKFADIDRIVSDHMANKGADEKVIFYAKNRSTVDQIKGYLKAKYPQYGHVEFTGATKKSELGPNKQRFKHDPTVRFSIHMRAGVEGLNLQYDGDGQGATTAIAVASGEDSYAPLDQFFSRANRTGALKDIDGHLVLTDTPHDMGTQVRLDDKKAVGSLVQNKRLGKKRVLAKAIGALRSILSKSHIKEHYRTNPKTGAKELVHEYDDKRSRKSQSAGSRRQAAVQHDEGGRRQPGQEENSGKGRATQIARLARESKNAKDFAANLKPGMGAVGINGIVQRISEGSGGDLSLSELHKKLETGGNYYLPMKLRPESLEQLKLPQGGELSIPADYENDDPIVVVGGEVIDGIHRALAAIRDGRKLTAYMPAEEWYGRFTAIDKAKSEQGKVQTQLEGRGLPPELIEKCRRKEPGKGGEISLTKGEALLLLKKGVVGLVSAGINPEDAKDKGLDQKAIDARTNALKKDLIEKGLHFRQVLGKYGEEEDSFMVFTADITRDELVELGEKYNQDSVIFSDADKNEMIFTTGENKGKKYVGSGFEKLKNDAADFFTELTTPKGKLKFSLNFNFDKLEKGARAAVFLIKSIVKGAA